MEEIKKGEYVRTKDGYIRKVKQVNEKGSYEGLCYGAYSVDKKYKNSVGISAKKIINHSPNIIDLIEVGDYVNGYKVVEVMESLMTGELNLEMEIGCPTPEDNCQLYNKDIKSIVTKEQFSQIKYKLEEKNE